ncbi:Elongation factor Tu [Candidatus Micrarchaeum sp.]|jgi:elongation factor 1-alpha|uniref:translation elongation factor EF-1 subunit alpha n=1 Tax=Candidatus Micrarchaeum sp. TaxID=2282148 RepID=UPI00092B1D5D|nr:translation elongation factor EF-1 subunit alpha [Candidatus Micrarchaeum sp.]OJI06632.1 MAG: translation elongation factor EF-1 subunit alpha [Candidatus Micrarchaeum sp. ARMAN-1]OJT94735.1 MAG: elongation factor 1-alpha [Candidatus Micrarchaeum sp. AZ1]OWP53714.1 MAG: translation elongation factor EF-1 subunit alpha [Thermoplasmatales archaeon ARMAN]QRF74230.1 Elongation factor Tu [Candidatus Micrarchaeum sp.]
MSDKPHMNLIFIGHVDHGKSTTVGRLLYETHVITDRDIQRYKELTQQMNRPTFEFAFVMDQLKEERERGITIDIMHRDFQTPKYYFTIIDAPGHRDFVKNMITGASQADAAVLVVSAVDGVQAQTREHAILANVLGIAQMIVGVNKMDAANYDQKKFEEAKANVQQLLKSLGYRNVDAINFVPYSALAGDNVAAKSDKMPWYNGPTLLGSLDLLTVPAKPTDKPLRLPIQDVYSISGFGTVPVGRVETGVMKPGDQVIIMPSGAKAEVKSIEMHHQQLQKAEPGDNVGFNIKGVDRKDVKRGDVVGPTSNPPMVVSEFKAQIIILHHQNVIAKGYTPVFHIHTAQIACTITDILEKKDPKTGQVLEQNPETIKTGDIAIVKIKPTKPICAEKYSDFPQLGRFAIRDMGETVGAGVILDVTPAQGK